MLDLYSNYSFKLQNLYQLPDCYHNYLIFMCYK